MVEKIIPREGESKEDYLKRKKIDGLVKQMKERHKEMHKDISKDPNFFNIVVNEGDKKMVGEKPTRKVIHLVANGKNVENPTEKASFNLLVGGSSGIGKDYVTSNTLDIHPKTETIKRRRITRKVMAYWHNAKFEPEWTWDKKVFYCEDIPNSVLNEDVFKVMASSGNAISTVIINQKAIDIQIVGKPVIIVTGAEADPKTENLRRFPIVGLSEGVNQTKAIMKRQSEFAKEGKSLDYDENVIFALGKLKRVKVKIPFADKIAEHFPTEHYIMRTNYPRFLDYIKSSCAFYQYQRKIDDEGYHLAEEQDYEIARECFTKTISSKSLIPITSNQKKVLNVVKVESFTKFSINDLLTKVTFLSDKSLRDNLDKLTSWGFFKKTTEKVDGIAKPVFFYEFIDQPTFEIPTYIQIITNTTNKKITTNTTNTTNTRVKEVFEVNVAKVQEEKVE